VNLEGEMIKGAPAYLSGDLNREYELKLYRHYGRFANWADEPLAQAQLKAKNIHTHPTGFLKKCWNNLFSPATRRG
jgi:hypothetical protein